MRAPRDVGEGFVDRDALDRRREIAEDRDGGVAEPLVFVEMSADKNQVGTELPRASSGHPASYSEGARFVGGRQHDPATDRNRLAAQMRVQQLFDGGVEGVEVGVENGGWGEPVGHHTHQSVVSSACVSLSHSPYVRPTAGPSGVPRGRFMRRMASSIYAFNA